MTESSTNAPDVAAFAEIAGRFCAWAEAALTDGHQEMLTARRLLAEIHLAFLRLPALGCGEAVETDSVSDERWKSVYRRFGGLPVRDYRDVFDPLQEDGQEPLYNSLPDDLADIYRDLRGGLTLFEAGHGVEAVWEWRFGFYTHWGAHLTGAQRAIHGYFSRQFGEEL